MLWLSEFWDSIEGYDRAKLEKYLEEVNLKEVNWEVRWVLGVD